jgi:uncharacterized protein YecE (DUF72 family)
MATLTDSRRARIGTAGWNLPKTFPHSTATEGTHLQRYARLFDCAEINSAFHRPHATSTYARWATSVPSHFRFAVKIPRHITHELKLIEAVVPLEAFLAQSEGLAETRGPLLLQLPPSLMFDLEVARRFFEALRARHEDAVVCEPRHASWFDELADSLLREYRVARVAADPPRAHTASTPGGWRGLSYFRLHGSPRVYWSSYTAPYLAALAERVAREAAARETWCIFDNTASGAAVTNAWDLGALSSGGRPREPRKS